MHFCRPGDEPDAVVGSVSHQRHRLGDHQALGLKISQKCTGGLLNSQRLRYCLPITFVKSELISYGRTPPSHLLQGPEEEERKFFGPPTTEETFLKGGGGGGGERDIRSNTVSFYREKELRKLAILL